ncbi:ferredoxin [Phytohabitans suffuscus]|uniref:Ferredoxin n=1 Tax=Phytohabitans suffuscus TaxID=624315 RepID=A0A6F8YR50_9ACTN|nr:hypothetical protein Psuf_059400 [Phytohabitans suffuscus]
MRAQVDPQVCTLSGYCSATSPDLFVLGEAHAEVRRDPIDDEHREAALEAEAVCPTAAIRLIDL